MRARAALHRGDVPEARRELVSAQRLRPLLTYALPYLAVQARIELTHAHVALGDLAGARTLLTGEYAEAVEQGAETDLPFLILHLAELETWAGNYDLAEEYSGHGYQVAQAAGGVPAASPTKRRSTFGVSSSMVPAP